MRTVFLVLLGGLLAAACARPAARPPLPPAGRAEALVTADAARFVFPPDSAGTGTRQDGPGYGSGPGAEVWYVLWDLAGDRLGVDPDMLGLRARWRPADGRPAHPALLAGSERVAGRTVTGADVAGFVEHREPDLEVSEAGGRVVLTVRGRAAVRRLLPAAPDTVRLLHLSETGQQEWRIAVRRR